MPTRLLSGLRNHAHVLIIVPLVVIVMTWPTFIRIFDGDEFWLHSTHFIDAGQKLWDAWHMERVLAGESDYFYTDAMFHPLGVSLAFHASSAPHAFLLFALKQLIPVDDAYNLLFLLMLCFNAFCAYVLIHYLLRDRWIALFGAVVVGVNVWFTDYINSPDLLWIGTLPLTVCFLLRSYTENRWRFAALAGICAGVTAFMGIYILMFTLLTAGICCLFLSFSRWRQPAFWLRLLLFIGVCAPLATIRFCPMFADADVLREATTRNFSAPEQSFDAMDLLVNSNNPFTGKFLHAVFNASRDEEFKVAYLGYLNLFLLACALVHKPLRRRSAPWLVVLLLFIVLRLGDHLTYNVQAHTAIALPGRALREMFPLVFGQVTIPKYYQIGVITPLAVLSCFGLSVLLRTTQAKKRVAIILCSTLVVAVEYFIPREGYSFEREKTSYIAWLQTENESKIHLINLPQSDLNAAHFLYLQSISGYPSAYGFANRGRETSRTYIDDNLLLRRWRINEPVVCLPRSESHLFIAALDELLQDGFTHIVMHRWLDTEARLESSFVNVPPAYDNGHVSVYRLADMRRNCQPPPTPPPLSRFLQLRWRLPEHGSSVISIHASQSIDHGTFAFLGRLFSNWDNLIHLYWQDGEWVIQSASALLAERNSSAQFGEVVYLTYDAGHRMPRLPENVEFRDDFHLCQREAHADNAVIELYLRQRYSCSLIDSSNPLRVEFDEGPVLENMLYNFDEAYFDLQFLWSNLPSEPHSVSLQVFDAEGAKVLGQDSTIGHASLSHVRVDISSLPPGDYVVKLIVYDFHSRVSAPGTVSDTGERFERELLITTLDRR